MVEVYFIVNIIIILNTTETVKKLSKLYNNIILVGPMGSGKTSIGRKLAQIIGFEFIDTDTLIEEKTGASISTIFAHEEESGFREREKKLLKEIDNIQGNVISTGGGIILMSENRSVISKLGYVVYLTASKEEILKRTKNDKTRPLLNDENIDLVIDNVLKERDKLYSEVANIIIKTDKCDTLEIAKKIKRDYESFKKNNS